VKTSRGWDYYFSTPSLQGTSREVPTTEEESRIAERKREFEAVAVSGQQMLTWAQSLVWVIIYPLNLLFLPLIWRIARLPSPLAGHPPQAPSNQNAAATQQPSCLCDRRCASLEEPPYSQEAREEATGAAAQAGCSSAGCERKRGRKAN
jgi:hypothetical protein